VERADREARSDRGDVGDNGRTVGSSSRLEKLGRIVAATYAFGAIALRADASRLCQPRSVDSCGDDGTGCRCPVGSGLVWRNGRSSDRRSVGQWAEANGGSDAALSGTRETDHARQVTACAFACVIGAALALLFAMLCIWRSVDALECPERFEPRAVEIGTPEQRPDRVAVLAHRVVAIDW